MGSWTELDAIYPPGKLTPATALVVALGRLEGATDIYEGERLAAFLPPGLSYDADLIGRATRYLTEAPLEQFFAEAQALLSPRQRLVIALHVLDRALALGDTPARRERAAQIIAGIGADGDALAAHRPTLALKNDLGAFTQ
ncbi:MAG: hypothetical protein RMK84_16270 [Oscillochloridaceae bacterium]|nr:hypothetical protein [Chloroflexaceae bacterium]MDW8391682.1 hypothetical protein [Oscillochloridaceae bacterium]